MTDIIDRAITDNKHFCRNPIVNNQTWHQFKKDLIGRSLFIFGISQSIDFLWMRSGENTTITGIIDNDVNIQGNNAGWYIYNSRVNKYLVSSMDLLKQYAPDEVIILVTSINYYEEIITQLSDVGITNAFSLLTMEVNWRKEFGRDDAYEIEKLFFENCRKATVQYNKLIFSADNKYREHGKYIAKALLKKNKNLDIVWILKDMNTILPKGMRAIYYKNHRKISLEASTAGFYITDGGIPLFPEKKKGQIYIHTKHWASVTLKRFFLDASTITDILKDVERWKKMFGMLDYIITGSEFDEDSCRRGFSYNGKFIRAGSPRSDVMFRQDEVRKSISRKYGIPSDCKLIAYAPTYRYRTGANGEHIPVMEEVMLNYKMLINAVENKFNGKWVVLLRLHPSVVQYSSDFIDKDYVIDVSLHQDGEEIAASSDILITDYSSIMFEPAFVKKPVFLFAPDRDEYIDKEYDLLIDYDSLPFPIAETNEELVDNIMGFDQNKYVSDVTTFLDKYGVHEDGHASERAAEFILGLMRESE